MCAEFDTDADADDEVDETDGIEGDVEEGHCTDDVGDDHDYCNCDDRAGLEGSEEYGGNE